VHSTLEEKIHHNYTNAGYHTGGPAQGLYTVTISQETLTRTLCITRWTLLPITHHIL